MPDAEVETLYGVKWDEQNLIYFKELATRIGFNVVSEYIADSTFFLELIKKKIATNSESYE